VKKTKTMTPATKLFLVLALGLVLVATAMADDKKKHDSKGPCKGGYYPDRKGCCPAIIKGKAYYRDGNKCYPKDVGCGVYYADGHGYAAHLRMGAPHTSQRNTN
jgi:hypothetical protein